MFEALPERIQSRISSSLTSSFEGTACWEWTGLMNRNGYGYVWWKGKNRVAHRVVYEITQGEIPEGLLLDHRCCNRGCVHPAHTEPVTPKVNTERGRAVLYRKKDHDTCRENTSGGSGASS